MKTLVQAVAVAVLLVSSVALAQPRGGGHGPPPEALAACTGKAAGDSCSFSHGDRAVQGTCFTPSSDKPLACRPAGAPPPHAQ